MMGSGPGGSVPTVSIIIVNWNSGGQLSSCLASIAATATDAYRIERVVVVDNASNDRSADSLQKQDLPLCLVRNATNRGFAAACNQAANGSQADYLLFLNPDTRLFPDSLTRPLSFMELPENQQIGIAGVQLVDDDGRVSRTCARLPTPGRFLTKMFGLDRALPDVFPSHFMTEWDHRGNRAVEQVIGAFFLVRRSLFDRLGGFDERFFVYFEEVDLSARARALGYGTFYLGDVQAYHRGGGVSEQVKDHRLFYSLRSRILYVYKHFGWWSATGVTVATLLVEPVARLSMALARGSIREFRATLKGYALLLRATPAILKTASLRRSVKEAERRH